MRPILRPRWAVCHGPIGKMLQRSNFEQPLDSYT
jgi:hypothetical protein